MEFGLYLIFLAIFAIGIALILSHFLFSLLASKNNKIENINDFNFLVMLYDFVFAILFAKDILTFKEDTIFSFLDFLNFGHILNILVVVGIYIFVYIIFFRRTKSITKKRADNVLEKLPQKIRYLDDKLRSREMSFEEASEQKDDIYKECDFYASLSSLADLVSSKISVVIVILYLVSMVGGCLIGVFQKSLSLYEAVNIVSFSSGVSFVLCLVPIVIFDLALCCVAKQEVEDKKSKRNGVDFVQF